MAAESLLAKTVATVPADTSGLLQTLQGHVEDLRGLLQCGICVRPLYEPYTLACGHTFCYGCLTSWFASGRSHKTCPDCRAQVKNQPAPAYLVRALVQFFISRAELLDKDETTAEHDKNKREEAEKLEADKSNENPRNGGLFQGFFKPKPQHSGPIIDAEDGVARCPHCAWELEDDACLNCGYHVDDDSEGSDFTDDFSDMTSDLEDMDEDMDDDFDDTSDHSHRPPFPWDAYPGSDIDHMRLVEQFYRPGTHVHFHPIIPHQIHHYISGHGPYLSPFHRGPDPPSTTGTSDGDRSGEDDEEEEEDDDGEMDSFIDDGEIGSGTDHSTVVGDHSYTSYDFNTSSELSVMHNGIGGRDNASISGESYAGSEPYYFDEPDEEEEENEEHEGGEEEEEEDDEEDEEGEEEEEEGPIRPAARRRIHPQLPQPQQQPQPRPTAYRFPSQYIRAGSRRPHPSSVRTATAQTAVAGTSASNAINVEDDSEDEMPVPASRRARLNRH